MIAVPSMIRDERMLRSKMQSTGVPAVRPAIALASSASPSREAATAGVATVASSAAPSRLIEILFMALSFRSPVEGMTEHIGTNRIRIIGAAAILLSQPVAADDPDAVQIGRAHV